MISENEFCILHIIEGKQCLIDTTYNHGEDCPFELSVKFWADKINGYIKITLSWEDFKETDFIRSFDEFKDPERCIKWMQALEL